VAPPHASPPSLPFDDDNGNGEVGGFLLDMQVRVPASALSLIFSNSGGLRKRRFEEGRPGIQCIWLKSGLGALAW
jgi:hypothetical protein